MQVRIRLSAQDFQAVLLSPVLSAQFVRKL